MNKSFVIILIQILFVFTIITIITLFIRLNNAIKLEKRIAKYSVRYNKERNNISLYDRIKNKYLYFVKRQRKKMKKLFPTLVKRYDKYIFNESVKPIDYITHKFVIGSLFTIFVIVALAISGKVISLWQLVINFLIGFLILDIILFIKRRISIKTAEDDILKAIIVMNSAFKSGKSIIQAVSIVPTKISGIIGLEFKKIAEELKYGLSVSTVFNRFAKRIKIAEAEYLSSSLTILNRTGGNIVAVFDSIERTLLDKKKLKEELKNSTAVSKLVVKVLLIVPIVFVLIVYLFDPSYFNPFFESTLGYVLFGIIILMFLVYAYLLDKIVKVNY